MALLRYGQWMFFINHFFTPGPSMRLSATDKKPFSMVSCPIFVWSFFTLGSREVFPLSKTPDALPRRTFFHLSNLVGMDLKAL